MTTTNGDEVTRRGGNGVYEGAAFVAPFWEHPFEERWRGMFEPGLRAHLLASARAAPLLIARDRALIVSTATARWSTASPTWTAAGSRRSSCRNPAGNRRIRWPVEPKIILGWPRAHRSRKERDQMAKFGVLGSGEVGQELAKGLRDIGHEVRIGSRDPKKLSAYSAETKIPNGTFAEVAKWGEALVLAVLGSAAEGVLRQAGLEHFAGKLVIDTTNPTTAAPPLDGVLESFTGPNESLMERLQKAAPRARFVKAFNSVGADLMVNPKFEGGKPTMFYCGDDPAARAETAGILEQLGWEGADMGTAVAARAIEPLAVLWCIPGFREDRWTHAFKLLTH